jgi:uncharacterized protein (DUF305 family)
MMQTENQTPTDESTAPPHPWADSRILLAFATLILGFILGFWGGRQSISPPVENSAEVGFARDMATHHAQAVNMAHLLYDRTDDPDMQLLALDIMLTQQAQIGQMQGWLNSWGHPLANAGPSMIWMGMPTTDLMPGMATVSDINRLRDLKGIDADGLFLQLMIPHHRSGVEMANAVLGYTDQPEVIALAQAIVNSQSSEIDFMQSLLQAKGFPPVPEQEQPMHHAP